MIIRRECIKNERYLSIKEINSFGLSLTERERERESGGGGQTEVGRRRGSRAGDRTQLSSLSAISLSSS